MGRRTEMVLVALGRLKGSRLWMVLLGIVIGGPGGLGAAYLWGRPPPVVTLDAREVFSATVADDDLHFLVTKLTNELCRTRVARWLWRWDPEDPRPIPAMDDPAAFQKHRPQFREINSTPDSPPVVGPRVTYRISVPIRSTDHIEPGDWYPVTVASDECNSRDHPLRFSSMMGSQPVHISSTAEVTQVPK